MHKTCKCPHGGRGGEKKELKWKNKGQTRGGYLWGGYLWGKGRATMSHRYKTHKSRKRTTLVEKDPRAQVEKPQKQAVKSRKKNSAPRISLKETEKVPKRGPLPTVQAARVKPQAKSWRGQRGPAGGRAAQRRCYETPGWSCVVPVASWAHSASPGSRSHARAPRERLQCR